MKTLSPRRITRTAIPIVVIALGLQLCALAQAQPGLEPPEPNQTRREGRRFQAGPGGLRAEQGAFVLEQVLTADQRDSLRQAMESQREKIRALQEKIRTARQAMLKAALADEFKEKAVKTKALEVAKLEAEVSVIRMKIFSEVQPALSAEQLEKILNPPQPRNLGTDDGNRPQNRRGGRPPRSPEGDTPAPRDSQ
jgi:Spy/CpxP family protein refolding chaperone